MVRQPSRALPGQAENRREADLSTEQAGAQAPPRFPEPVSHGAAARCSVPPGAQPEAAERLTRLIPWPLRATIAEAGGFLGAATGPRAPAARSYCRPARAPTQDRHGSAFTVSKVGNAVERNRVRRRIAPKSCGFQRGSAQPEMTMCWSVGRGPEGPRGVRGYVRRGLEGINQERVEPERLPPRRGGDQVEA
jgi:hypothetical protein